MAYDAALSLRDEMDAAAMDEAACKAKVKAAQSKGGKKFCVKFEQKGSCPRGSECPDLHNCNVLIGKNRICMSNRHAACKHSGKTVS